jgi:hypothetical protein
MLEGDAMKSLAPRHARIPGSRLFAPALVLASLVSGCLNEGSAPVAPSDPADRAQYIQISPRACYGGPGISYPAGTCGTPQAGFAPGGPIAGPACAWPDPPFDPAVINGTLTGPTSVGRWVPYCNGMSLTNRPVKAYRMTVAQYQAFGPPASGTFTFDSPLHAGQQQLYFWINPAVSGAGGGVTGVPVRLLAQDTRYAIEAFPIQNPGVPTVTFVYGDATGLDTSLRGFIQFEKSCMDAAIAAAGLGPNDLLLEISVCAS